MRVNQLSKLVRSFRAFSEHIARPIDPSAAVAASRPTIGLALGGGFARGMSHVGIIKVLEQEGIPIDYLAGTSVGAVMGAMYCSGVSVKEMEELAALVRFRDFARWTVSRFGFCSNDRMGTFFGKLLKCTTFEDLKIPLAIAATDFKTGEPVIFRSGKLVDAIRASCAYPGMFLPVELNGRLLVDGLLAHPVPTQPVREMGADRVIGVYLAGGWSRTNGPRHVFDVIGQCFSIAQDRMCTAWKSYADLTVLPNVEGVGYDQFEKSPELIRQGENAIRAVLPEIKKWLERAEPVASTKPAKAPKQKIPATQTGLPVVGS